MKKIKAKDLQCGMKMINIGVVKSVVELSEVYPYPPMVVVYLAERSIMRDLDKIVFAVEEEVEIETRYAYER